MMRYSVDNDQIAHAHLLVQEVATVRLVRPGSRDKGDAPRLMARELDFAVGRGARGDARRGEEPGGGEIMPAARSVDEIEGRRLAGPQMDRRGREAEILDFDRGRS